jgi:hypothetical protein
MNTDNYDFEKSSLPQDLDGYTPFLDKQSNTYINDQNSGVYSASQSLVQFDLSSLYNSSKFTNTTDAFITIPITMVCALSTATAGGILAPPKAGWALQTLKSGYHHLIHQADLQIDGKTISETQPFLGTFTHIRLLSEMSQNDLKSIGTAIGFSDVLDTASSAVYNGTNATGTFAASTVAGSNGNGLANNLAFGHTSQPALTGTGVSGGAQNVGVCNEAINKRVLKVVDTTSTKTGYNTIFNASTTVGNGLVTPSILSTNDFKSTYTISGNYGIIYDVAVIRLKDIFDCMNNIGLVKKFSGVLRLYINTGSLSLTCVDTANPGYFFSVADSNFTNVCPFTINNLGVAEAAGGLTATSVRVNAGLFIAKALPTNLGPAGINLFLSGATHPMQACRLYYSSIQLEPEKALAYSRANQAKNVVFRNYYFNQINGVDAGGNYSQLIQSGITNPYALIVVPYISNKVGTGVGYQWQSPFDTCPATGSPCVLENLQVQLGGQQVLNSAYNYGFETFLTQYVNSEALSSSDFGVSCGVVSKEWWEMNRIYYVNLSRSTRADQMTPRNIVLSFKNSSKVAIDLKVFTVYLDRIVLNVDTGAVTR